MTSFSDYRYFSPFWASAERFQTMNRTVAGFSALATLEHVPDLKALYQMIDQPLRRVSELRKRTNAVRFRTWLETTAGESPPAEMVREYLDSISGRNDIMNSTPRKLVKALALAAVGVGVGSVAGAYAGEQVGTLAGLGGAAAMKVAAEKLVEIATDTSVALFDSVVLDRVVNGWSPRMFFDDITRLRERSRSPSSSRQPATDVRT